MVKYVTFIILPLSETAIIKSPLHFFLLLRIPNVVTATASSGDQNRVINVNIVFS